MRKKIIGALTAALLLSGCGAAAPIPQATVDPYAGMVQVESGYGTKMWVREYEDVARNPLRDSSGLIDEAGVRYARRDGIDVSEHQGEIDWAQVAATGLEFALIRAGYRGYGESGALMEDAYFAANMTGAAEHGLERGVYFFSQAVSVEEAEAEAAFLLELLADYAPETLALPVFFDWENIDADTARTDDVPDEVMTDCALAFCARLREAGYTAGIYAFRYQAYYSYDLSRIRDYPFWIGAVGEQPDYYYAFDIWQRSTEGKIAGIEGPVDLDVIFVPLPEEAAPEKTPAPAAGAETSEAEAEDPQKAYEASEKESPRSV